MAPKNVVASIWRIGLFTKKPDEEIAICTVCCDDGIKCELSVKDGTTSTIIKHLKTKHSESIFFARYSEMVATPKNNDKITKHFPTSDASVGSLEKRIVNFVACNLTSFKCINDPTLHALIKYGNTSADIKDESHYRKHALPQIYHVVKQRIISMIKDFEYVSFTTDAWSGPGDSYLSLTLTGITNEWKRVSLPLAVSHFPGSHTSEAINKKIHDLLELFQIDSDKCHVFLRDGGANVKKCFQSNEFLHADCGSHLLNLVVRDSLKPEPISDLLKKCRAIVGHFKHSNSAMDHLKDLQIENDLPPHMLLQDMPVRWNCAYYMADRLIEQKFAVQQYVISKQRLDLLLNDNEWEKLSQLRNLLSYAEELSKLFCDNPISVQCGFASLTMSGIEKLNFADRDVTEVKQSILTGRQIKFGNLNLNRIHGIAHFLDPRFKDMKSGSSQDVEIVHSPVTKRPNYGLLADFDDEMGCEINVPSTSTCDPTTDLWKEIVNYASKPRQTLQMQDPLDSNKSKASDPMDWWKKNSKDYPLLSKFAKRYLTPDCTTRMSEGLFSTARNVFTYQRMSLKPRKAQMIIFLNRILPLINYRY